MRTSLNVILLTLCACSHAADWYVSTNGSGSGSILSPWPLQTALTNSSSVNAGDTIWLRGGVYFPPSTNAYSNNDPAWLQAFVAGTTNNCITIRSYPGEWAVIDGLWSSIQSYVRFRDVEFIDSLKGHHNPTVVNSGNGPWVHFSNGSSIGNEWINCVIHDIHDGFTGGYQVRGCVIWYVGWNSFEHVGYPAPANMHGNISGWHMSMFTDGVMSNVGLPYGTGVNYNIVFGGGQTVTNEQWADINTSGSTTIIHSNYCYNYYANGISSPCISSTLIDNMSIIGNVFASPLPMTLGINGTNVSVQNNVCYQDSTNGGGLVFYLSTPTGGYTIDNNQYYSIAPDSVTFAYGGVYSLSFATWKTHGIDASSTATDSAHPSDAVYVIPNADTPLRAHIAVYNWTKADNVTVDVSSVMHAGQTYQLISAQNYNAGAIKTGTLIGTTITVPMTNLSTAAILYGTNVNYIGETPTQPPPTSPEFGAFVLIGSDPNPFIRVVP